MYQLCNAIPARMPCSKWYASIYVYRRYYSQHPSMIYDAYAKFEPLQASQNSLTT
jgi:hypothetical protein